MPTAKVYGLRSQVKPIQKALSEAIEDCVVEGLGFPPGRRLQRFILMDEGDFYFGTGRSKRYLVIEIDFFVRRSVSTIKKLINLLYERIPPATGILRGDIDIIVKEVPQHCWGLKGKLGDEQDLDYNVAV